MSDVVDTQRAGFTFIWKIENFSLIPKLSKYDLIGSPFFTADNLDETIWGMILRPAGYSLFNKDAFEFCLTKRPGDGQDFVTLDCELSIIFKSGLKEKSVFVSKVPFNLLNNGTPLRITPHEIFSKREILPDDTLTVQCKMWRHGKQCLEHGFGLAHTRIGSDRKSFTWAIDKFSTLQVDEKKSVSVKLPKYSNLSFVITLYLTGTPTYDEKIRIKVEGNNEKTLHYKVMLGISILNINGEDVYHFEDDFTLLEKKEEWAFPLILKKKQLSSNKDMLLPDDILSLKCAFVVSSFTIPGSIVLNEIERITYGTDAVSDLEAFATNSTESPYPRSEEHSKSLTNDLRHLFDEKYLADINLRVRDEVFPVHKAILAARSSVFKTMFDTNMREKFTSTIEIEDFEPYIMRRMLLYIYSDTLGSDIDWENVFNLCLAAEKYSIISLKEKCCSFLKVHLSSTNVCKILFLADILADEDLKNSALSFIEKNDKVVMNSSEWKDFVQKHPQLTVETVTRLYRNLKKF